ncbi:hypothetical protein DL897_17280 [Thermoflavimicrobium daqui]|uniref:Uncharacterized protein n=1 Tax=Thermoflavimicrobium daqui TaxID=2137476 RepID=A0A364K0U0_9BACL|nr:hypothetical protein DL897_17280 [Thermoflavimicrobium daqui]
MRFFHILKKHGFSLVITNYIAMIIVLLLFSLFYALIYFIAGLLTPDFSPFDLLSFLLAPIWMIIKLIVEIFLKIFLMIFGSLALFLILSLLSITILFSTSVSNALRAVKGASIYKFFSLEWFGICIFVIAILIINFILLLIFDIINMSVWIRFSCLILFNTLFLPISVDILFDEKDDPKKIQSKSSFSLRSFITYLFIGLLFCLQYSIYMLIPIYLEDGLNKIIDIAMKQMDWRYILNHIQLKYIFIYILLVPPVTAILSLFSVYYRVKRIRSKVSVS